MEVLEYFRVSKKHSFGTHASELPRKAERCLRALLGGGGVGSAGGERRLRLGHTREEGDGMLGRSKNIEITLENWKIWLVGFVV